MGECHMGECISACVGGGQRRISGARLSHSALFP